MEELRTDNRETILAKYKVAKALMLGAEADMSGQTTLHWDTLQDFLAGHKLILEEAENYNEANNDEELENLRQTVKEQAKIIEDQALTINTYEARASRISIISSKVSKFTAELVDIADDLQQKKRRIINPFVKKFIAAR